MASIRVFCLPGDDLRHRLLGQNGLGDVLDFRAENYLRDLKPGFQVATEPCIEKAQGP